MIPQYLTHNGNMCVFLSSLKTETMFSIVFIYRIKHKTEAAVGITYAHSKIHHRSHDNLAEQ